MGFKLVRVDAVEPYKVSLTLGSHFIGRGKFLDCNDNRVSRNHAELIVTTDSVILKSLHQNPCFLKKKSSTETVIFSQPDSQALSNGDQFGLIPDNYWYEVIQCSEDSSTPELTESKDIIKENENPANQSKANGDNSTQYYIHEEDEMLNCSESLLDALVNTPFHLPQENQSSPAKEPENESEKSLSDPEDNMDTTSTTPVESTNQPVESTNQAIESTNQPDESTNPPVESTNQPVKSTSQPDESTNPPVEPTNHTHQPSESTIAVTPTKRTHSEESSPCDVKRVKMEPVNKDSNNEDKTQPYTPATALNQAIKTEPGPQDAQPGPSHNQGGSLNNGNPALPPSPTKPPNKQLRERCMYGANCYRRNPQHKVQFSHPSDPDWGSGPQGACPWGASCQRADPRHWRDHEHPPGARQPPPRPRLHRPGRRQRRQRSPTPDSDSGDNNLVVAGKRARKLIPRQDWSDSEDEDPYHTDDSDEWEPPSDVASQEFSQDSGVQSQSHDL